MTAINPPTSWTQTGRRASEGDAHSVSTTTTTPPLIGAGAGGAFEPQEGRQEAYPYDTQHQSYPSHNYQVDHEAQPEDSSSTFMSVSDVGIAGSNPLPPSMTRARSSNEISIVKAKPQSDSGPEEATDAEDALAAEEKFMEGRLRSIAARAERLEPSASFPVALEKARSRREHELDGRRHDAELDEAGARQVYETSPSPIPHGSNSFPLLNAGQAGGANPGQDVEPKAQLPLVLPDYLLPTQAGSDRPSNRPDLMDLGAYRRMQHQQHHGYNNGGNGNPYNVGPHGPYSGITPPSSSHSPVSMMYPGMQRGDHVVDYLAHPSAYASGSTGLNGSGGGMNPTDPAFYRPSSASASSVPSPYEGVNNPYLAASHTPPLPGMYGQQPTYYNPYATPHDARGAYLSSPVNSPPVSPAMGMKPWLPPVDDDSSVPGPQTNSARLASPSMSSLSPSMAPAQLPNMAGGWNNRWQGQPAGMGTTGRGQAGFYGVPSWDHESRAGGVGGGTRGSRTGRGDAPRNFGAGEPATGVNNVNGRPGPSTTRPRGGATFRPAQPGHTSSFGSAVQNMPVEGYLGNGYGNGPQGGYHNGPSGYVPYQTGYYAGLPSYLGYAQLAEATRPEMPSPMTSPYNGRGGRGGGVSGRRGRWSTGVNGPAGGPLHQAQGPRPISPEGQQGHKANVKSMSSINDVFEQMVLSSAMGPMQDAAPKIAGPGSSGQEDKRAAGRKHYHPAAPPNRSEWVMWVGNVPNNSTHEEMWKFFNQPIPREAVPSSIPYKQNIKVSSIFLISRSSCAFVNLETQDELLLAISFFNHRLLRPSDPRCPKLVCRVRKMDDDLKAGVGGQRGAGIHTKYVQDMLTRQKAEAEGGSIDVKTPEPETPLSPAAMEFPPEGEGRRRSSVMANVITPAAFAAWQRERSQSGTHSFASTNSSFLGRHFPKRYFILKSLTHEELETSVKTGKWRTQLHNEAILDQAFRTSPEVYLIFGANKQGSFYGWAVMRSGINDQTRSARSISCGSRGPFPSTPPSGTNNSAGTQDRSSGSTSRSNDDPSTTKSGRPRIPHASSDQFRMTTQSPGELSPSEEINFSAMRLPGEGSYPKPSTGLASVPEAESRSNTLNAEALARIRAGDVSPFKLDDDAPHRAAERRANSTGSQESQAGKSNDRDPAKDDSKLGSDKPDGDGIVRHDMASPISHDVSHAVEASGPGPAENQLAKTGTTFEIEWVKTGILPFHRLRHLRNPWNQDKEVKVSRDGTELEPTVGALLLAEWDKLDPVGTIKFS